MKIRILLFTASVLAASLASAQSPSPVPAPQPKLLPPAAIPAQPAPPAAPTPAAPSAVPTPPTPPGPPAQNVNVKVELQITEDGGTIPPVKKSITVVVGDFSSGYLREQGATGPGGGPGIPVAMPRPLNFDVRPQILPGGKIRLTCTIQYTASPASDGRSTDIKQNLVLVLESGKALVVSQATDPVSDRRVTVEVTATTLK